MPRGDKASYTGRRKRQAKHIEAGYKRRGLSTAEAERRAWATVNRQDQGGKKSGSGRGKPRDTSSSRKGGRLGGRAAARRPAAARRASAKKSRSDPSQARALTLARRPEPANDKGRSTMPRPAPFA
jgi:plasmid stabilization system protein ParE